MWEFHSSACPWKGTRTTHEGGSDPLWCPLVAVFWSSCDRTLHRCHWIGPYLLTSVDLNYRLDFGTAEHCEHDMNTTQTVSCSGDDAGCWMGSVFLSWKSLEPRCRYRHACHLLHSRTQPSCALSAPHGSWMSCKSGKWRVHVGGHLKLPRCWCLSVRCLCCRCVEVSFEFCDRVRMKVLPSCCVAAAVGIATPS